MNLYDIENPTFLKKLSTKELVSLANDIRAFLIENISQTGGHLSSNLGVVELTIAMHYVFDSPNDKFIFDVGHQCYTHKILTGRAKDFSKLRKYNGLSGFINRQESNHDIFESGHSSTSLSAQSGFLVDEKNKVIALIGDASIANGISFEALNYMGTLKNEAPIIILNDNKMSISSSVGAVSRIFSKLRSSKFYQKMNNGIAKITPRFIRSFFHKVKNSIKGLVFKENIFEDFGFDYMGPFDGNDISVCIKILKSAKNLNKPCVIHFVTKKGKGYEKAENDDKGTYHSISPFDIETGKSLKKVDNNSISFAGAFSNYLLKMIEKYNYYVISPAMIKGSELEIIQKNYPKNIFDVGIAEEHATVMASAMAQNNKKVVLIMYSTFAQRAYDFFLNDIARTNTHLIIGIDHADFVCGDGQTHQGIYDISMFSSMPNFQILAPRNMSEVGALLEYADKQMSPVVIRYPKGIINFDNEIEEINKPTWKIVKEGKDVYVLSYGKNVDYVLDSVFNLDIDVCVINTMFIRPIDEEMLQSILNTKKPIILYENCVSRGGVSSFIYKYMVEHNYHNKFKVMGLDENDIVPVGDIESLRKQFNLSSEDLVNEIRKISN